MKKILWMTFLALAMILASCSNATTETPLPSPTVETAAPTTNIFSANGVVASAEAIPARHAQLSFVISAPVKEILVNEGDAVKAGQPLMNLFAPDLELAVTEAEYAVKSAELQVQRAYDPYKKRLADGGLVYVIGYREKRQEVEARLAAAQAVLDAAKARLAQTSLAAPFDGAVIDISVEVGESTQPGKVVLTLGDTANMQIETTDLSERDIPRVKIGQDVNVYIESLDTRVTGRTVSISPIPELVGGDVVYRVTISLDEQPKGLLWGMSAEVEILTAQ